MIGLRSPHSSDQIITRQNNDISRLLDPSYTSSYYRPTQHRATYGPYVDAHGDMHDPDYRQFPIIYQSPKSQRYPTNPYDDDSALLLDDDEDTHDDLGFANKRNSFSSTRTKTRPQSQFHYPSTRRSNSPTYSPTSKYSSGAILASSGVSPISTIASSSASSSSSVLSPAQSPADTDESCKQRCRISALKKRRRTSATTLDRERDDERAKVPKRLSYDFEDVVESQRRRSIEYAREDQRNRFVEEVVEEEEQQQQQDDDDEEEEQQRRKRKEESVPTCGESLQRQWQALSLRIRFGMFRAERRIKKRVQSLI
ncbi:hypothetical protein FA15DRAFT_677535 [Coprinopsis marcescibilis]|uniref:Uncharacterized protein n=1 Tax=Coprinopsis marcescibilis TaxID=230819 RepID=A0A5C3LC19_COPMA|nr:hypothetical protein FA15DRAFT_677535 [Coprinopsis marcescibilis]